jgi:peptide deformylase
MLIDMIYPIVKEPSKILREKAQPFPLAELDTPKLHKLVKDMILTMIDSKGVGLAAPQIGIGQRIIVVGAPDREPVAVINPEIKKRSFGNHDSEEGCLSVPGTWGFVKRSNAVTVTGLNPDGTPFKGSFRGFEATIYQHEIDHINGILFIDKARGVTKLGTTTQI